MDEVSGTDAGGVAGSLGQSETSRRRHRLGQDFKPADGPAPVTLIGVSTATTGLNSRWSRVISSTRRVWGPGAAITEKVLVDSTATCTPSIRTVRRLVLSGVVAADPPGRCAHTVIGTGDVRFLARASEIVYPGCGNDNIATPTIPRHASAPTANVVQLRISRAWRRRLRMPTPPATMRPTAAH